MPKKVPGALLTFASVLTTFSARAQIPNAPLTQAPDSALLAPPLSPPVASETPPVSLATREAKAAASPSWFARLPLTVGAGEGAQRWQATIYGFIEADAINDSTRSYVDSIGNTLVARNEFIEGKRGRTQFSIRNTRLGFALASPAIGGLRPSAVLDADFFGNQPNPPGTSEAVFFNSPTLRLRQAYLKLEDDYIDVWIGQTYYLFGWQNYFFPSSLEFLGLPNQAFGRTAQVRFAHTFETGAVSIDVAVAALRPAQADSEIPDGNAGNSVPREPLEGNQHSRQRRHGGDFHVDRGLRGSPGVQGERVHPASCPKYEPGHGAGHFLRRAHSVDSRQRLGRPR